MAVFFRSRIGVRLFCQHPFFLVPLETCRNGSPWSATDPSINSGQVAGSGVKHYDVLYRVDDSEWVLWLNDTTGTTETYNANPGHTYAFRVCAVDHVGNEACQKAAAKTVIVKKYYSIAGQRVAMRSNGVVHYIHGDHLGSASLTTDINGGIHAQQRYFPYGEVRWQSGSLPTDRQYTDQRREAALGDLYDYRARFYSPRLGRFLSADTIIPDLKNSQDLNRYAYVRNNPIIHVDPTGHQCIGGRCPDGSQADDDIQSAMWFAEQYPYDDALVMAEVTKWLNEHPDYDLFADPTAWIEVNGQIQPRNFYVHYAYVLWRADRGEGELLVRQSSAMSAAISGGKFQAAFKKDGIPWEAVATDVMIGAAWVFGTALRDGGTIIYRGGGRSPNNLVPRPKDNGELSFRDSISNALGEEPVLRSGKEFIAVDISKLPPGSVIWDNVPDGHVSVKNVPLEIMQDALIGKWTFPR